MENASAQNYSVISKRTVLMALTSCVVQARVTLNQTLAAGRTRRSAIGWTGSDTKV